MVPDEDDPKNNKFLNPEINDMKLIWEEIPNRDKEMIMMICTN
jgi:hypothetical protein